MSPPSPLRPRDHLRALLVVAHVLAVLVLCIPAPPGGRERSSLEGPAMQQIIGEWRTGAAGVGLDLSQESATDAVFAASQAVRGLRQALQGPPRRYARLTGAAQGWGMFAFLKRRPARLVVSLQRTPGGPFEPLYRARDPALAWRAHQLDAERMRALINPHSSRSGKKGYLLLVDWLACRAAEDFPGAVAVRVEMEGLQLSPPAATLAAGGVPRRGAYWTTRRALADCGGSL